MEKIFYTILGVGLILLFLGVIMPQQMFSFIQAIEVEFVEITNGSDALIAKLGFANDSLGLAEWERNLSNFLALGVNSTVVDRIIKSRIKEGEYLRNIDSLSNFVTMNIRYKERRNLTNVSDILSKLSGDDRAHVILLASLFNGSKIDFRIDVVEEETRNGRGYHFRTLVGTTLPEEKVREMVIKRIRKKRFGISGTKAKVWYVQGEDIRWYLIDTTGQTMKKKDAMVDTSWIFIGASHQYYANRSHYSFELPLG